MTERASGGPVNSGAPVWLVNGTCILTPEIVRRLIGDPFEDDES